MVAITRSIRDDTGIDFAYLVDKAQKTLRQAEEQGDVKGQIAALGLLGRLTGFELEAQMRRDTEFGRKVAAVVAAAEGKSAKDIIDHNAPGAAAFMAAIATGVIPSDPKTMLQAGQYILNRAEGVPVGADIVQVEKLHDKLTTRLKVIEDRTLRAVN